MKLHFDYDARSVHFLNDISPSHPSSLVQALFKPYTLGVDSWQDFIQVALPLSLLPSVSPLSPPSSLPRVPTLSHFSQLCFLC